jgi:CRISPR-associated protein Cas2
MRDAVFYVISYDIVNDRRRTRVMKLLQGHGTRVQRSVFECLLEIPRLTRLLARCNSLIDPTTDSVRAYRLCANCRQAVTWCGIGHPPLDEGPVIG